MIDLITPTLCFIQLVKTKQFAAAKHSIHFYIKRSRQVHFVIFHVQLHLGILLQFTHESQETRQEEMIPVSMDIFLLNGAKVSIDINSTDRTHDVLEVICLNLAQCDLYIGLLYISAWNSYIIT